MAFDDIVKALTVQISADDLTGGLWGTMGKSVKEVWNNITALNQAWELGSKIYGTVQNGIALIASGFEKIAEGGNFAEAEASFAALARSHKVNGALIMESVDSIVEGEVKLNELIVQTGEAVKQGFSQHQIEVIYKYAKAYEDAFGGNVLDISNKIFDGFATGVGKGTKALDLFIEKDMDWIKLEDQLIKKTKEMGDGAFNAGDRFESLATSQYNAFLKIKENINFIIGESGFEGLIVSAKNFFDVIRENAPFIAGSIFIPIIDAVKATFPAIQNAGNMLFELFFDKTDSLKTVIRTIGGFVGNVIYEAAQLAENVWNLFAGSAGAWMSKWYDFLSYMGDTEIPGIGKLISEKDSLMLDRLSDQMKNVAFDTAELQRQQDAFNKSLWAGNEETKKTVSSNKDLTSGLDAISKGLLKAGQEFDTESGKKKKSKEATKDHNDELKKQIALYDEISKIANAPIEAIGKNVEETQKGLNELTSQYFNFLGDKDKNGSGMKSMAQYEMEQMLKEAQEQKERELSILQDHAYAQKFLAQSMIDTANKPKKIEFIAPNQPNVLEALIAKLIETLQQISLSEGTSVQG